MAPHQRQIRRLTHLGVHVAQFLEHHESTLHERPFRLVGVDDLEQVIAASGPPQIFVGQPQQVVGEVHFGSEARLVVGGGGGVEPLQVLAGVEVGRLPVAVAVDDLNFPRRVVPRHVVKAQFQHALFLGLCQRHHRRRDGLAHRVERHRLNACVVKGQGRKRGRLCAGHRGAEPSQGQGPQPRACLRNVPAESHAPKFVANPFKNCPCDHG